MKATHVMPAILMEMIDPRSAGQTSGVLKPRRSDPPLPPWLKKPRSLET